MTFRYRGKSRNGFNWLVGGCVVIAFVVSAFLFVHAGVSREMVLSKVFKHALSTLSAVLGFVLTVGQGRKAFQKAEDHEKARATPGDPPEVETNLYNSEHFWRVGALWYVGALAALATITGEALDFYNDSPMW